MKKGQGISVNMLIIIVIALIVLAVAITMLVKNSKKSDAEINKTTTCGFAGDDAICDNPDPTTKGCGEGKRPGVGFCTGAQVCCTAS